MFGITPFGMFHTVIALIAVVAGFTALAKYREIGLATAAGRVYVLLTIATCVTGNPKVFAGGDCINGGKEVVNAVADGRNAARTLMERWAQGQKG